MRIDGLRAMVMLVQWSALDCTTDVAAGSETSENALGQGSLCVLRNECVGRRYLPHDLDQRVPERWSHDREGIVLAIVQVLDDILATRSKDGDGDLSLAAQLGEASSR